MPYTVVSGDNLWSIWSRMGGGVSWADFKALNAHLGNLDLIYPGDSVTLPGDAPAAAPPTAPAPTPAPRAAPAAPATPSVPMQIEPGAWLELQGTMLEMERQWRERQAEIEEERVEQAAMEMELRLSTTPIDYVAYQLYKRQREAAGQPTYTGPSASSNDIQAMIAAMVGPGGGALGEGEFGVQVPRPEAISRAESLTYSPAEMDILGSFLRAGFEVGGREVSYDPVDYWQEVEEGFIPTIRTPAATQYSF